MRRLFLIFSVILFLFSCSTHLAVLKIDAKNVMVDQQTSVNDSVIETFLKPYRDSLEQDMSKLIAISETPIVKGKPESKLTNLVSDILLEFGQDFGQSVENKIKPVAAYVNYGGLRGSLPLGKITVGNIFELMPFENEVVMLKISGDALRKMADKIAARGGEGIAGMTIGIREEKVSKLAIGGQNIDSNSTYWLVTNDYVANGGDQMNMFLNPAERINTGMKIRNLLIKSLHERYSQNGIISVKEDGRIYNEQ